MTVLRIARLWGPSEKFRIPFTQFPGPFSVQGGVHRTHEATEGRRQNLRIWMDFELCEPPNCSDSAHILRYRSTHEFYRFRAFQRDSKSFTSVSDRFLAREGGSIPTYEATEGRAENQNFDGFSRIPGSK